MTYVECVYAVSALAATDCVTPGTATPEYYDGTTTIQRTEKEKHWVHFSISETKDSADAVLYVQKVQKYQKDRECQKCLYHHHHKLYTLRGSAVHSWYVRRDALLLIPPPSSAAAYHFHKFPLSLIPLVPRQRPWEGGEEEEEGVLWAGLGWGCPALISKEARVEGGSKRPRKSRQTAPKPALSLGRRRERKGSWNGKVLLLSSLFW